MRQIEKITAWIDLTGQKPTPENIAAYLGHTLSELAEGLEQIADTDCQQVAYMMQALSMRLRRGELTDAVDNANKVELLDSAIDTMWTSIGIAHMLGDAPGAFNEVCASNYSKMVDGEFIKDETGKVMKGPNFFRPDLKKYLR